MYYKNYPETSSRNRPFFIEFSKPIWNNDLPNFKLFKTNYTYSQKGYKIFLDAICRNLKPEEKELMSRIHSPEGHPFSLHEGKVTGEDVIALTSERMLKFIVDAMNDKYEKDFKENRNC